MRILILVLLVSFIATLTLGCGQGIEYTSSRNPSDYSTEQELANLVDDSEFAQMGKDWILDGASSVTSEASKGIFDSNSIVFTGEGKAVYTIKDVEPGTYSLRYFLKGQGDIPSAEMNVQVDGKGVQKIPYHPNNDWFEYASSGIVIEKKSVVTINMQVKGLKQEHNGHQSQEQDSQESLALSANVASEGDTGESANGAEQEALENKMSLYLDNVRFLKLPTNANGEPFVGEDPVSFLAKREDGSYYMEINNAPSLSRRVDVGFVDDDFDLAVQRAAQAGFDIFTVTLPWNDVQATSNKRSLNFSKIDLILAAAEKNNMKVDLIWAGSSYNGTLELAPNWVQYDHSLHSKASQEDSCEVVAHGSNGLKKHCIGDHNSKKLLTFESVAIEGLIDYIDKNDVDRRIVSMQLEHNPAAAVYASRVQSYESTAYYINELAKIIKTSERPMLIRVNSSDGLAPHFVFNTEYIDYNSSEVNSDSMAIVNYRFDAFNSRIPAISSGNIYANTPSQSIAAYLKGSSLAISIFSLFKGDSLESDNLQEGFLESEQFKSIRNLNIAVAKIEGPFVTAPDKLKTGFNYSIDKPITFLNEVRECDGTFIKCQNIAGNAPVSLAFVKDNAVYCISDSSAYFSVFGTLGNATVGSFSRQGVWTDNETLELIDNKDGSFGAVSGEGQVLKIQVINSGKPSQ